MFTKASQLLQEAYKTERQTKHMQGPMCEITLFGTYFILAGLRNSLLFGTISYII
jgi:hypothetical protein